MHEEIWKFSVWSSKDDKAVDALEFLEHVTDFGATEYWGMPNKRDLPRDQLPKVSLKLTHPTFCEDIFHLNLMWYVSARMREVMALDEDTVRFHDVDMTGSSEQALSMDYKIMVDFNEVSAIDFDKSDYSITEYEGGYKSCSTKKAYIRDNFVPENEIFREKTINWVLCTDSFTRRLLKADIRGFRCFDPMYWDLNQLRYRSKEGLVEDIGGAFGHEEKLIRKIPLD